MPLRVLHSTEPDAPRAAAIEAVAYGPNLIGSVLFPKPQDPGPNTRASDLVDLLRKNTSCQWAKVIDTELSEQEDEDEMIAFSMWYMWESPPTEDQHSFPSYRGPSCNAEACELLLGGINSMRMNYMKGKLYACMPQLYTFDDLQIRFTDT
ncbi:hypothetical protein ACLX1H_009946 [Fusarium chlamydosporum]